MTKTRPNRLGFAILLIFFRQRGRFPRKGAEVEAQGIVALSKQLDLPEVVDWETLLPERTAERLRAEIRERFGFREISLDDVETLTVWLRDYVAPEVGCEIELMIERLETRCRELSIEPPTPDREDRIARAALHAHEDRFQRSIYEQLGPGNRERLDALLHPDKVDGAEVTEDSVKMPAVLLKLRGSPGRPSLASMQEELEKLELIRQIDLPGTLFDLASPRDLERFRQRVSVEPPQDLRRHPDHARITWLAASFTCELAP